MLSSLLARGTERLLDVWLESTNSSSLSADDVKKYSIGINILSTSLPSPAFPWRCVADVYGQTISPIYQKIQSILNEDLEYVAELSSELEQFDQEEVVRNTASDVTPVDRYPTDINPGSCRHDSPSPPRRRKRRRSLSPLDHTVIIPSPHSSVPTILITPCPTLPRYISSVPLQDASYGNKLTVPGHSHFNSFFPPLNPTSRPVHTPFVTRWKWEKGHWKAVVPDLETQMWKGWFSRPLSARRAVRPCTKHY